MFPREIQNMLTWRELRGIISAYCNLHLNKKYISYWDFNRGIACMNYRICDFMLQFCCFVRARGLEVEDQNLQQMPLYLKYWLFWIFVTSYWPCNSENIHISLLCCLNYHNTNVGSRLCTVIARWTTDQQVKQSISHLEHDSYKIHIFRPVCPRPSAESWPKTPFIHSFIHSFTTQFRL